MKHPTIFSFTISKLLGVAFILIASHSGAQNNAATTSAKDTLNDLRYESSEYLLRNARSPVLWQPWSDAPFERARKENKLIIVSIGYSACHWCHVMEDSCFADKEVAAFMNEHFVCIKVDRDERPDIDQAFMPVIHWLTRNAGWPLNAIAVPDGTPVTGGTYFNKSDWLILLKDVLRKWNKDKDELLEDAVKVKETMNDAMKPGFVEPTVLEAELDEVFKNLTPDLDTLNGGFGFDAKFPRCSALLFIENALSQERCGTKSAELQRWLSTTLDAMMNRTLYDHLAGGFGRYTTDEEWRLPHFEKMLFVNAQLTEVYLEAFQLTGNTLYLNCAEETLAFIREEMTSGDGTFYSALGAEAEVGKGSYYKWTTEEFDEIFGERAWMVRDYYNLVTTPADGRMLTLNIHSLPYWREAGMNAREMERYLLRAKKKLKHNRSKRESPERDEKIITAWNAQMIRAYVQAYRTTGSKSYLQSALKCANFLDKERVSGNGSVVRFHIGGNIYSPGFLDDYAMVTDAFIELYEVTLNEHWLLRARTIAEYVMTNLDSGNELFLFSSQPDKELFGPPLSIPDDEEPSANGVMAQNLLVLGYYFENDQFVKRAKAMYDAVNFISTAAPLYAGSWNNVLMLLQNEPYLVVASGKKSEVVKQFNSTWELQKVLVAYAHDDSQLPSVAGKQSSGAPTYYACRNKTCKEPTNSIKRLLEILNE